MKKITFIVVLILQSLLLIAQPGPEPYELRTFRLYNKQGQIIAPDSKDISVSFLCDNFFDSIEHRVQYSSAQIGYERRMFNVNVLRDSEVTITWTQKKETMIIHTYVSLDSIMFRKGEYRIDRAHEALVNKIAACNKATIVHSGLKDFKVNPCIKTSFYRIDDPAISRKENADSCMSCSKKIEAQHGGVNWAANTCNNQYQAFRIHDNDETEMRINKMYSTEPNKIRIKIYPLKKNILIKHEFFLADEYLHVFSVSYDLGLSWTQLISVKDEWYVSIVYFPDLERIGIMGQDFLLISDYHLANWKYYCLNYNGADIKSKNYAGLVLRNENWFDNYYYNFKFSE